MLKKILRIIAISGILLFIYYFIREGPISIWERIKGITFFYFFILIFLRLIYWSIRSFNWYIILRYFGSPPSITKVFMARLGSHSVGYLTPTAKIGGEVVRVILFKDADKKKVTASVVIDKMTEFLSAIFVVSSGVFISVLTLPLDNKVKILLVFLTLSLSFLLIFFFKKQREGFFSWFIKKIRIGVKFFNSRTEDISATDSFIAEFYKKGRGVLVFLLFSNITNYVLWIFEIYFTLHFLGSLNITIFKSFLIATLGSFAFIFPFLPASLGIFEVTYLGIFKILGINQTIGISYILIRRILGLLFAGAGLIPVFRSGFRSGRI